MQGAQSRTQGQSCQRQGVWGLMETAGFGALYPSAAQPLTDTPRTPQHKIQSVSPGLCSAPHVQGPCPACLHICPRSFHSSRFPLGESDVSQRTAAAFKAQAEPGGDLLKLLGGRDFLWGQNVSRPSGQHLGAYTGLPWPGTHPPAGQILLSVPAPGTQLCAEGQHRLLCRSLPRPCCSPAAQHSPERAGSSSDPPRPLPAPCCSRCALPM